MYKTSLTQFDEFPEDMLIYLRNYGFHFNKKLCKFAVSKMTKKVNGRQETIKPYTTEEVDNLLKIHGIKLEYNELQDHVYVANMCKADFLGSSIIDEKHLAKYIKDVIDDDDAYDGIVFIRWYADMSHNGTPIEWSDML